MIKISWELYTSTCPVSVVLITIFDFQDHCIWPYNNKGIYNYLLQWIVSKFQCIDQTKNYFLICFFLLNCLMLVRDLSWEPFIYWWCWTPKSFYYVFLTFQNPSLLVIRVEVWCLAKDLAGHFQEQDNVRYILPSTFYYPEMVMGYQVNYIELWKMYFLSVHCKEKQISENLSSHVTKLTCSDYC